jgi:hypothetical protein
MTVSEFLAGDKESERLFRELKRVVASAGRSSMKVTKSQIAFRRRTPFAWAWRPRRYLGSRGAPLVLSVALPRHVHSPRWKEVVEPRPGRFMHHLELHSGRELDAQVQRWIREAWDEAQWLSLPHFASAATVPASDAVASTDPGALAGSRQSSGVDAITPNGDLAMGWRNGHSLRRSATSCAATASKSAHTAARETPRGSRPVCRTARADRETD